MLALLSPSKTLDFDTPHRFTTTSQPELIEDSKLLTAKLKRLSAKQLSELMGISSKLATENRARYIAWKTPFTNSNARPAALAFKGDVYEGLQAQDFSPAEMRFAQQHVCILSGLYGVLRPLDLIQAYRLEMGTRLATRRGKDLYSFWGDRITDLLNRTFANHKGDKILLNLASNEYFKAVRLKHLNARELKFVFKEKSGDQYKMISFFAKKARGMMAAFFVKEKLSSMDGLKDFKEGGYRYNTKFSSEHQWVYTR